MYPEINTIKQLVDSSKRIVIIQADNPDADSLGSALALEQILGDLGKDPILYCAVDMPSYLRYMRGWDRIQNDVPNNFDCSIIVDASTMTLLEKLQKSGQQGYLATKPCIVLDHHKISEQPIPFATITINDPTRASAGELIYLISKELGWKRNHASLECIMSSILGDTQGLSNDLASAETYRIMAEMIEAGIHRPELEERRREYGKMPKVIFSYKAKLIQNTEFFADDSIACVTVSQDEIHTFSPLYNPGPLVQNDMLQTKGVKLAIVLKNYDDGKITGAIRANPSAPIAAELASHFNGGGHAFASGFKVTDGRSFATLKTECIEKAEALLNETHNTD